MKNNETPIAMKSMESAALAVRVSSPSPFAQWHTKNRIRRSGARTRVCAKYSTRNHKITSYRCFPNSRETVQPSTFYGMICAYVASCDLYERRAIVMCGAVCANIYSLDTVRYSIACNASAAAAAADVAAEYMQRILFSIQSCRGFRLVMFALRSSVE